MKFRILIAAVLLLGLSSCSEMAKDIGLDHVPDLQQRSGPVGTLDNPAVLDPFKKYDFVMAADECRFFMMKVPEKWYWKIFLTAVNREDDRKGKLATEIIPVNPPWGPLADCDLKKTFELKREGVQAVLGIFNAYPNRPAVLRLCQEGAPLRVTIASQVSTTTGLLGPKKDSLSDKGQ